MSEPLERSADPGTVDADNPWPGLAAFREADHDHFHGREAETQEILRLVLRERLTVLFGLSGLGKTSLLRAGLFPHLRQENVLPVYIRLDFSDAQGGLSPAAQVRREIRREAAAAGIETPAWEEAETLWESLHRQGSELWSPRNRIVTPLLVFDQFEEIFTLGRRDAATAQAAEAFLTELADLCEGAPPAGLRARLEADPAAARAFSFTRHPYKILLSLREDFLPELEGLRDRIRSIVHNRYRLQRMNGTNALCVITRAGGHLVEEDVPGRIVDFVAGRAGDDASDGLEIEPALLSVVCRELNHKRRAQGLPRITAALVQGNRDEILSGLYERSVGDLGAEVRSFIEERLLTRSGFRDSVALENAVELPGVTRAALDTLTDRRLLRIEDHGGMQRLELTHDVLTGVIRKSRDLRRQSEARGREEAARREAERKLRRSRLALGALGLALAVVVALAAWGFVAQRRANQALALADVGKAWFLREDNPAHALAHLARALRTEPDNAAAQSLLGDLLLARNWPLPIGELRLGGTGLVEISPDGRLAAAAGEDGTIRLWDTETLQPVGTVRQTEAVESLDLGAGGRRVLALSPGTARLWDTAAGRELWSLDLGDHSSALLSPDGRRLAWSRDGQSLHLRDLDTGTTREIPLPVPPDLAPFGGFETFSFSPDSRTILASDGILTLLWEVEGVRSLPGPGAEAMQAVRFTPDSRYVLVSGDDQTDLWNPATAAGLRIGGSATQAWLSPAGDRALTYGREQELRVWDVTNPDRPLATVPLRDLAHAEVSTDGKLLLTVSDEGVSLWETDTGRPVSEPLCDCAHGRFRAGTRHVVTGDDSGVVRIWRPEPTHTATDLVRSAEGLLDPLFSRDGSRVAIRARDGAFRLWDTDAVQPAGPPLRGLEAAAAGDLGLSTDGRFLLERRGDTYRFWDTGTGQPVWHPLRIPEADKGSAETLAHLHLSPALELFGLKSDERTVQLWSLANGRQTAILQPGHAILYFTFTPAGDRLLTAGANGVLRTWDARTGRPLGEDIPHEGTTFTLDVSPDGGRVVTGTRRGLVRIWDLATGRLLTQLVRHRRPVESVRFQGDGRLVLVRDLNLLRVWDSQTGLPASTIVQTDGIIWQTRLDPSGSRLLVSSKDEPIRLLDARFGQPLTVTPLPSSPSTTARFSPNGQLLWTVNSTEVHVFTVPLFPKRDRDLLVRWAEAVAGWTLDADGRPVELNDQLARLDALRRDTAGAPLGGLGAASLVRWFLADPAARTASPVFDRPQAD